LSEIVAVLSRARNNSALSETDHELLALYGAAYKVVYERLSPDNCNRESWPALCATAEVLSTWAAAQEQPLRQCYERAIADVVERASACVENQRRGVRLAAVYDDIPKPPV
jgi:hypothetical protein